MKEVGGFQADAILFIQKHGIGKGTPCVAFKFHKVAGTGFAISDTGGIKNFGQRVGQAVNRVYAASCFNMVVSAVVILLQ